MTHFQSIAPDLEGWWKCVGHDTAGCGVGNFAFFNADGSGNFNVESQDKSKIDEAKKYTLLDRFGTTFEIKWDNDMQESGQETVELVDNGLWINGEQWMERQDKFTEHKMNRQDNVLDFLYMADVAADAPVDGIEGDNATVDNADAADGADGEEEKEAKVPFFTEIEWAKGICCDSCCWCFVKPKWCDPQYSWIRKFMCYCSCCGKKLEKPVDEENTDEPVEV